MSASPEKNCEIGMLLDLYGALLTERQRDICEFYYDDDLSLAEVAEECGISRQGVRDALIKSEAQLFRYEEALGLSAKMREKEAAAEKTMRLLSRLEETANTPGAQEELHRELEELKRVLTGYF